VTLNYCKTGGTCVGTDDWLPARPFDYDWVPRSPYVGCNRLRCQLCGAEVRSLAFFELPTDLDAPQLYEILGAGDTARLTPQPFGRIYACRCYAIEAVALVRTQPLGDMQKQLPWSCEGHPRLEVPVELEGIPLDGSDWKAVARQALDHPIVLHPEMTNHPGFWLQRLYRLLAPRPAAEEVSRAAGELLLDPEVRVRLGAISFFLLGWDEPGAERLAPALREHPELFVNVVAPGGTVSLERWILSVLEWRVRSGDPEALDIMRAALFRTFTPLGVEEYFHLMGRVDRQWFVEHADQLLGAQPGGWRDLLAALATAGASPEKLARWAREVRERGTADGAEVRKFIESHYQGAAREAALRALGPVVVS
jgi:hypothetical protein